MTFNSLSVKPGRQPATILELDLDACTRSYGISPCTADLAMTNLLGRSEQLQQSVWVKVNSNVTVNFSVNPIPVGGGINTDKLKPDDFVTPEVKQAYQVLVSGEIDTTTTHTFSVYALKGDLPGIAPNIAGKIIRVKVFSSGSFGAFVDVDLRTGLVIDSGDLTGGAAPFVGYKIDSVPVTAASSLTEERGWYRISLLFTFSNTTDARVYVQMLDDTGGDVFIGQLNVGLILFGMQLRPGTHAGKYAETSTDAHRIGDGIIDDLCFNTFGTCQDTPNYNKEVKTYRFADTLNIPIDLAGDESVGKIFPAIVDRGVKYTPTRLQPGGGMSLRGKVTIRLQDFTHNDFTGATVGTTTEFKTDGTGDFRDRVDKYAELRTYDAESQGSFFGRLKARNEFYVGRPMRVLEGYMDDPFSLANFRTREYIIEEIRGPTATGIVEIIGRDVLSLAIDTRAKAPTPSVGILDTAINGGVTTVEVSTGDGAAYDTDKHIRIDDEIMEISSRSVDDLTVIRGAGGTIGAAHDAGAAIQSCLTYENEPIIDVIDELLTTFANVPASFIPTADWEAEETASLAGYLMETIISEPTGVTQLLKELVEITLIDLWYSDVDQEIKLKLETPFTEVTLLIDDQDEIIKDSLRAKDVQSKRLTRVLIWYGMRNFAESLGEPSNFSLGNFEIEADKELANKFNDERVKVIFTRWFDSTNTTQVQLTSARLLERFGRVPVELTFDVDAKDVTLFDTGDVVDIQSRIVQDRFGAAKVDRYQIIETQPKFPGSIYQYKALAFFVDPVTQGGVTISANQTDVNLFVEFGGPGSPIVSTITINAGVIIDSTQGNPALKTGELHPDSQITIINNGEIRGHVGNAGNGGPSEIVGGLLPPPLGTIYVFVPGPGEAGLKGGTAIENKLVELIVDNTNGDIFGGGGGGGGGGGAAVNEIIGSKGGGGGGGGRGSAGTGSGGAGGLATEINFGVPPIPTEDGTAGTDGSPSAAGAGGAGAGTAGAGSTGGDYGVAGTAGIDGPIPAVAFGGNGGAGGNAVELNGGGITWLGGNNPTQVKGDVS